MTKTTVCHLAFSTVLTLAMTARLSAQFKLVNSTPALELLPAHVLVPDCCAEDGVRRVSESAIFYNQQRFRLRVRPNQNGYLYILFRDKHGELKLLYPLKGDGSNYFRSRAAVDLPASGWFRFDNDPGQEEVLLVASPAPLGAAGTLERSGDHVILRHIFMDHRER